MLWGKPRAQPGGPSGVIAPLTTAHPRPHITRTSPTQARLRLFPGRHWADACWVQGGKPPTGPRAGAPGRVRALLRPPSQWLVFGAVRSAAWVPGALAPVWAGHRRPPRVPQRRLWNPRARGPGLGMSTPALPPQPLRPQGSRDVGAEPPRAQREPTGADPGLPPTPAPAVSGHQTPRGEAGDLGHWPASRVGACTEILWD